MTLPIQLISTDFDGTIFAEFEHEPIAARLLTILADLQSQGAKWAINTGRDMSSLMEALGRTGIPVQPDYLVLVEREIHSHDGVRYFGLHEWNSECTRSHDALFSRIRPDLHQLVDWITGRFEATVYEDSYSPFCLIARDRDDADQITDHLERFCASVPNLSVVRNDVYVRFSHSAYNKGTALAELARRLGVRPENTFAAGDHWNDLPMLRREYAHWLAAPSNAIEPVKLAIQRENGYISKSSYGDGVAEALELFHATVKTER
jgi:HAD superfamily hydrolase (TIGR01484 family)